ncbi:MAG TPA: DUF3293 domain-containing protein [Dokdonella sp.]|nr:DUF3293 domain-containing protein [Dokdonella sp.]
MHSPEQLVALYRQASYEARLPGGARATLRIGKPLPDSLKSWARRDWPLVFISACNPASRKLPASENRHRMHALGARLERLRLRRLVGVGRIAHAPWREPSFLVAGLSLEAADRMAAEFDQNAIVIAMNPASARLRIYRRDWRVRIDNDADIMWTGA